MEDFSSWIGRSVTREDHVTERLLAEYRATLDPFLFHSECPPGFHWGLAPALPRMNELGSDGAEARGLFLPQIPLARRMWAGGVVETFGAIRLGTNVTRVARIADIKMREGKTGLLCFVSVTHEIRSGVALLLRERQDLVFRDGKPKVSTASPPTDVAKSDIEWKVEPSEAFLFRFSAFTFNAHRVHYDLSFATETEGYGGLLVHGPLQAALLLNQASVLLGRVPARFEYRCTAPLLAGPAVTVRTWKSANGATGRILDHAGIVTTECAAIAPA